MTTVLLNWTIFFSGITMATFGGAGVFFLKLWKTSQDRFFFCFALACFLLSFERVVGLFVAATMETLRSNVSESSSWIYVIRLLAFLTILIAIVDKNRAEKGK